MSRLDRLLSWRVMQGVLGSVLVFYALIALSESLDTWRLQWLSETQGPLVAALSVVASTARWSIKALPVTVLIGAIISLLNMQATRELLVIKIGGNSIWRILRGPVVTLFVLGLVIAIVLDAGVTELNRGIAPVPRATSTASNGGIWIEQEKDNHPFVIQAVRSTADKRGLEQVVVFLQQNEGPHRIVADKGRMSAGQWTFANATLFEPNQPPRQLSTYILPTDTSLADLELKLSSAEDFTFLELASALASGVTDPLIRSAAQTRFQRLLSLPVLLVGVLLIAFAFTAGYRKTGSYGRAILYGVVLGFVVFVINEMADRAGSSGALDPTLAAWGPAIVAVVIGLTVLLYKEDGRNA